MLNALKNMLLTALMVIGATTVTAGVAGAITMLVALRGVSGEQADMMTVAGPFVVLLAAAAGLFFSVVSLAIAAFTLPPAIGLMRMFKLPRPLFDIFGGGAAGFLCAQAAVAALVSVARAKGGGFDSDETRLLLEISALMGGALLGYLRHATLVKKYEEPAAPQFAY